MNITLVIKFIIVAFALTFMLIMLPACNSESSDNDKATPTNLVVVNAPSAGVVRRVLVRENLPVKEGATILEIEAETTALAPANNNFADEAAARQREMLQRRTIVDARTQEKERTAIEVARVEALVRANQAPQSQLDAAQAEYQRAQERAQQPPATLSPMMQSTPDANNQIVAQAIPVRSPASGNLRVLSVRAGDRVRAGQPLATVAVE